MLKLSLEKDGGKQEGCSKTPVGGFGLAHGAVHTAQVATFAGVESNELFS